ncbi:ceramidase domain-containing protein [Loktanella sp. S4079]|uniref:ceramidase domain-containing protein n=1 Tax=Loktanella sp. S4079 TaxID=579483 RepID=UPI0005FA1DE0|nr:ceramidase domain-containing protein [Loktanella sp. S4079]KJZ20924.1 membrane protein [Loktanella sp. S4079]
MFEPIDAYCERLDPSYWSEPINALTNIAFIIAAIFMWRGAQGQRMARILCAILFAIGCGSYLFHTHATGWAALADVVPIGVFILFYLFLVHRDILGWSLPVAVIAMLLFVPFALVSTSALNQIPLLRISAFYWTVPILLFVYAAVLQRQLPEVAKGFAIGGAILALSICLRSLDLIVCPAFPIGTHFAWHCLNAVMLAWMIHVYVRAMARARSKL